MRAEMFLLSSNTGFIRSQPDLTGKSSAVLTSIHGKTRSRLPLLFSTLAFYDHYSCSVNVKLQKPPVATMMPIIINCLVFFAYQSGEDKRYSEAVTYYVDSGLLEREAPI
jgi:hypothetical protein